MPDWIRDISQMAMPFILAAGAAPPKLSISRVIEAVIIACLGGTIGAVGGAYLTVQKLDIKQDVAQKQFDEQVKRRNDEVMAIKAELKETNIRQQAQYEIIRNELQRIALATERLKPR